MRSRFPLATDQLELLLAFEAAQGSLALLAETLHRDASVISRGLRRLAETAPVLEKQAGKWALTALGRRVNELSRQQLSALTSLLGAQSEAQAPYRRDTALLMIVNAQKALLERPLAARSNPDAEQNVRRLLAWWRAAGRKTLHVKHVSNHADSLFHAERPTVAFLPDLAPQPDEWVVEKPGASAFSNPRLARELAERQIHTLVVVGFTADSCIDATVKQAKDLGFDVYVVGDATAMFDVTGPGGQHFPALAAHELMLATLHAGFATVLRTAELQPE